MSQSKLASALKIYSILPDNHSPLERALELSLNQQLANIEHPYPKLLDAWNTSMDVVPAVAAERLVPIWDMNDSDEVKRNLAGNAWQIRRLSGTPAGLKLALDSFAFQSEITPWHKQIPQADPYHLDVVAWEKGNKPVNVANAKKLISYIDDTKSERDVITLSLMFGVETSFGAAGGIPPAVSVLKMQGEAALWPMPEVTACFSLAGAVRAGISVRPMNLECVIPFVTGYVRLGIRSPDYQSSITLSSISAQGVL